MYGYLKFVIFGSFTLFILTYGRLTVKYSKDTDRLKDQNEVAVTILEECKLNLKHVIVFDENSDSTFRALSTLQPPMTVTLISNGSLEPLKKNILHRIGYQAIVMANYTSKTANTHPMHKIWKFDHDTVIIVIPNPLERCLNMRRTFTAQLLQHSFPVYYICREDKGVLNIFTFDFYGDTNPRYWQQTGEPYGNNNGRFYKRNADENICLDFTFERTPIGNNIILTEGVRYDEDNIHAKANRKFIGILLNIRLKPIVEPTKMPYLNYLMDEIFVDVVLKLIITKNIWAGRPSVSINENRHSKILSHHRGLSTPFEKITNFYGIWTLSSLIILLIITFLTIWLVARKKMSFAAFEVLRLLINTGLHVPMQNTSLRIFFTVIFLYFMVIHATFSGNLAKFLTKSELRRNAETIADLTDPRIETIYHLHFSFDGYDNKELLMEKAVMIEQSPDCTSPVLTNRNSVCIGESLTFEEFKVEKDQNNTLYIGKSLGDLQSSFLYQLRFPWRERFDYAIMYLTERELLYQDYRLSSRIRSDVLLRREKSAEVNFRKITLENLKFAFILLGIGLSLSLLCSIIEILSVRCKLSNLKKKSTKAKIININVIPINSPIE